MWIKAQNQNQLDTGVFVCAQIACESNFLLLVASQNIPVFYYNIQTNCDSGYPNTPLIDPIKTHSSKSWSKPIQ